MTVLHQVVQREGRLSDGIANRPVGGRVPRLLAAKAEWTHHAHLRVGLWHLLHYPPGEALDRLRDGIRLYNLATGGANTDTSGYHESITRFYVWVIARFLATADRTRPPDALAKN